MSVHRILALVCAFIAFISFGAVTVFIMRSFFGIDLQHRSSGLHSNIIDNELGSIPLIVAAYGTILILRLPGLRIVASEMTDFFEKTWAFLTGCLGMCLPILAWHHFTIGNYLIGALHILLIIPAIWTVYRYNNKEKQRLTSR